MTHRRRHTIFTAIIALAALVPGISPALAQDTAFESLAGGVKARTLVQGDGAVARPGQVVTMHFVGWLDEGGARGKELYNSYREGRPVRFVLGTDKVMPAWNVAVDGMAAGTRRMVLVPPGMAYGARGVDDIVPPNASLMFQIELIDVAEPD